MDLKDIIDCCRAEAAASKLFRTQESFWREACRSYSKTYHTPLVQVEELPVEHVLLTLFEDQMSAIDLDEDLDQLIEIVNEIEDPEYHTKKQKALDDIAKRIEEEEKLRIKENRPIVPNLKKTSKEPSLTPQNNQRQGGMINMKYLNENDNER